MKAQIINKKVMLSASVIRCGDKNVDTIVFECPISYRDLSLENLHVYVKTENRLGEKTKSVLYSVKKDDKLFIDWAITEEVTAINGILACQLSFESDDGEKVLNTNVFEVLIENSIKDGLPRVSLEYNHIIQLQNELQRALKEEVLRKGNDVSLLNNDANYLTSEKAEQTYLATEKAQSDYLSKTQASTDYLSKTQANTDYLSKTQANTDYLTKTQATDDYLTKSQASSTYLTSENPGKTYLTSEQAGKTYLATEKAQSDYLTKAQATSDYLSKTQASTDYLSKTQASTDYLTKTQATNDYLTKSQASSTYLTSENAGKTYLTSEKAQSDYLTKAQATSDYLSKTQASTDYLTKTQATNDYLTKSQASSTYLTSENAGKTYLTSEKAQSDYLTKAQATSDYLSKTQANTDYLSKTQANTDYLSKTQASTDYLTKTQASTDYLTKTQATNDYLTKSQANTDYTTKAQVSQTYATKEEVNNLSFGLFFENYQTFLQEANNAQRQPKLNCIIRIKNGEVCDLCVSAVKENFVTCSLTEEQFAQALLTNGYVQAGYCEYLPAKALAYSDSLPEVDESDAGKYLSVNESGEWQANRLEAYMGESEGGGLVETIKGVGIEQVYSSESQKQGEYTVTPVTFVKSDQTQDTVNIFTKNGCDITSAQSGSESLSGEYTITPVTFNKSDGTTFTAQVKAKNGSNGSNGTAGKEGVGILSIEEGTISDADGYTVTPVIVKKSDGSTTTFEVKAKKGKSIDSIEITDGELVINYDDGQSDNFGALYGVATADNYGMIKADTAYNYDTVPIRIASDGKLYAKPATFYYHTITVKNGTSKCMFHIISAKNTNVKDQISFVSVVNAGYHVATGIVNGNMVMAVRRTNTSFFMVDIEGAETEMKYSESTISDVVRTITVGV